MRGDDNGTSLYSESTTVIAVRINHTFMATTGDVAILPALQILDGV